MAGNSFVGTVTTGPGADSYREGAPGIVATIPASGVLNQGTPVRRNYLVIQGQNPAAYAYSGINPSLGLNGGDQVVNCTSTAGGALYGVFDGPTVTNFAQPTAAAVATSLVTPYITRVGVVPALVGCASGGTAVTVGALVGINALQAASGGVAIGQAAGAGFLTVITAPATTLGSVAGTVVGTPIVTALASAVTAGTSVAFNPLSTVGMNVGSTGPALIINPGGANQETVTPSSVAVGIFSEVTVGFANASAGASNMIVIIGNASTGAIPLIPGGIIGVTVACTTATTGSNFAASVATALNTAFAVYGEAPSNVPGVGGIRPFGLVTAATSNMSITAAVPSPLYNAVAVSVGTGTSTMTYPSSLGATSVGAYPVCYGTFANNHVSGEPIVGTVITSGATLCPVPQPGGVNIALAMVDLSFLK